jgi:hypothetical protein
MLDLDGAITPAAVEYVITDLDEGVASAHPRAAVGVVNEIAGPLVRWVAHRVLLSTSFNAAFATTTM